MKKLDGSNSDLASAREKKRKICLRKNMFLRNRLSGESSLPRWISGLSNVEGL